MNRQSGQGMLEYILIVVLVVVGAIGAWRYFGKQSGAMVDSANSELKGVQDDVKSNKNINKKYESEANKIKRGM